jgi:hypothetical protein
MSIKAIPAIRHYPFVKRMVFLLFAASLLLSVGCGGGGGSTSGGGGGGTPPPPDVPALASIAPSGAAVGAQAVNLVLYGSNFENGAYAEWNGTALSSSWVSATEITATIPASDIATKGSAKVTVTNPGSGGGTSAAMTFTVSVPASNMWVRPVAGVATPQNLVWDSVHGTLYVSIASTDAAAPNTIIPVNPLTATAATPVPAGNDPDLLSISSDSSYLWVGLDGSNSVQRFLLPGLTKDISFSLPLNPYGSSQQAVSLQAAPTSPHTVAIIAGSWGLSPPGDGVYVYDDATPRPTSVTGYQSGGRMIDWMQWGGNDSVIYGNQYTTIDAGGVATMNVTAAGVSLASYNGGQVGPGLNQYDSANGLLYSYGGYGVGEVFNPVNGSLVGTVDFVQPSNNACTVDASLGRYFCVIAYNIGGTDVSAFELWVFDSNSYKLLNRVYFGASAGQPLSLITGQPAHLVRWGNAGLAVTTVTDPYLGNAGLFLIDGAAINPSSTSDFSFGTAAASYTWMTSLTPQQALVGSDDVTITINGANFTQDSTACWNCNYLQFQYLPTSYVNPQQLSVTIPPNLMSNPGPLSISIFDTGTNLFSTDSLTFTVASAPSGSTQVTPIDLAGLGMAWDSNSGLLYVGVADYDGAYPNSIVAINGQTGSVVQSQTVSPDPYLLSVSANGQYLYVAFATATTMTQLQLPGLTSPLTWTLNNPQNTAVYNAGDLRAAPISPHTTAVTLFDQGSSPEETGGVVIYDDNVERPSFAPGWADFQTVNAIYQNIAWSSTDQVLAATCSTDCVSATASAVGPLYELQVTQSGSAFVAAGPASFNQGDIHSDFGTGLIYSDDGNVADPNTQAVVGTYNASGLVAPDSSLNLVFILGQTAAQANTNNFTIESFNENAYMPVATITLENLQGTPFQLIRWGTSGLAVLTLTGNSAAPGMLYLVQDATFVSKPQLAASGASRTRELVQRRWKRISKSDVLKMLRTKRESNLP